MLIVGYTLAFIMGLVLGLLGGGGSILAVPILVYVFSVSPVMATSYSLVIVGSAAIYGTYKQYKNGYVNILLAIIFAIPSALTVYLTRLFIIPHLPEVVYSSGGLVITKDLLIMGIFVALMIMAGIFMLKDYFAKNTHIQKDEEPKAKITIKDKIFIGLEGIVVGFFTGMIGAGGGFLIVPALVLLAKMPVKLAVGTSLFVISIKSLVGFLGDLSAGVQLDYILLGLFLLFTIIGVGLASMMSNKINGEKLQLIFAIFIFILAVFISVKELGVI